MRAFILTFALVLPFALVACESEPADAVEAQGEAIEESVDAQTDAIEETIEAGTLEGDTAVVVDDDVMDEPLVDTTPDTLGM